MALILSRCNVWLKSTHAYNAHDEFALLKIIPWCWIFDSFHLLYLYRNVYCFLCCAPEPCRWSVQSISIVCIDSFASMHSICIDLFLHIISNYRVSIFALIRNYLQRTGKRKSVHILLYARQCSKKRRAYQIRCRSICEDNYVVWLLPYSFHTSI